MIELRKYPDDSELVKAITDYRNGRHMKDYGIVGMHLHGESMTTWMVTFKDNRNNVVRLTLDMRPNAHVPGFHAETHDVWYIGPDNGTEFAIKSYPVEFHTLHAAFPDCEIVFVDNEDDNNYAFGYAALRNTAQGNWPQWKIVGWVQATMNDPEDNAYIANPKLPFRELVTDKDVLEALNDEILEYALNSRDV